MTETTTKIDPHCGAEMTSRQHPEHTHYCRLPAEHPPTCDDGHVCSKCHSWFWTAPTLADER